VNFLRSILRKIDGRGYKAYKELLGKREIIGDYRLEFLRIQGDPFATPSVISVQVPFEIPEFSRNTVGIEDFIYRRVYASLKKESRRLGEGKSGYLGLPEPTNIMIRRNAVHLENNLQIMFYIGLPARHRKILGDAAERMIYENIPRAMKHALEFSMDDMKPHAEAYDLQEELRSKLKDYGLVSFIGDGSILPRKCGDCQEPLEGAVPFRTPDPMRVKIETSFGEIEGMGIKRGITAIAGTAFHGKSTLLNAIRDGIYNHIPGDGRERVVTIRNSAKIRAEDGRSTRCVDIKTFIYNLPTRIDTGCFTTDNASGATSMAASIQEAVEIGIELLLVDEDTSATNLLYYDERADAILRHKTVRTLIENARDMADRGISIVIVSSGTMPLIESADDVIVMEDYRPRYIDVKSQKKFCEYIPPKERRLLRMGRLEKMKIQGSWLVSKQLSRPIRIENNEQIVERAQANYIAYILTHSNFSGLKMSEIAREIDDFPDKIYRVKNPGMGEVRGYDVIFAINRIPEIMVR